MTGGERWERRLWRMKRLERVAAVGAQRSRSVGKARTGHRNRTEFNDAFGFLNDRNG